VAVAVAGEKKKKLTAKTQRRKVFFNHEVTQRVFTEAHEGGWGKKKNIRQKEKDKRKKRVKCRWLRASKPREEKGKDNPPMKKNIVGQEGNR